MSDKAILLAGYQALEKVVKEYLETLDGIPDADLNDWLPVAEQTGGGDMNTLSGLSVHTALAGSWMIVHQVFGEDFERQREREFTSSATRAEIDELFATFLSRFLELIETHPDIDLSAPPTTFRPSMPDWTRATVLFHAVDHTALHLGHAQITRQLWQAERADAAEPA